MKPGDWKYWLLLAALVLSMFGAAAYGNSKCSNPLGSADYNEQECKP